MTESTANVGKTLVVKVGGSILKDRAYFIRVARSLSEKSRKCDFLPPLKKVGFLLHRPYSIPIPPQELPPASG
jgi:hypothetical protein